MISSVFNESSLNDEDILMSDALHALKYDQDLNPYFSLSKEEAKSLYLINPKGMSKLAMVLDLFIERDKDSSDAWFRGDFISMKDEILWGVGFNTPESRIYALVTCPQVMLDHGVILRSNDLKVL